MATTIKSTALDFNNIKNNLKDYLANRDEFTDYNFEAAGLSNILDVLAYNTHINSLIANFALNESFLTTAQLRSSVISLAEGLGYFPRSTSASKASVNIFFQQEGNPDFTVELPAFTEFKTTVDNVEYKFQTIEPHTATRFGNGFYEFKNSLGDNSIELFEGVKKQKTFYVGEYIDNPTFVIPDKSLDTRTVKVSVYQSASSTSEVVYTNITDVNDITVSTAVYILKEAPNGFFELSFGDGESFGVAPQTGNRIVVDYLSTSGASADNATVFEAVDQFQSTNGAPTTLSVVTFSRSQGGALVESIESIRKNAPFQYATQNRMVTAADYSAVIFRNFSNYLVDINSWGGQDNITPEFGAVYVSLVFNDDVSAATKRNVKVQILDLAERLSILSFNLRFSDPEETFIQTETFFQYNPNQTSLSRSTLESNVTTVIKDYFTENTGKFKQSYRRSNVLTLIDETSSAILSSRQITRMQKRITPQSPTIITTISNDINDAALIDSTLMDTLVNLVSQRKNKQAAKLIVDGGHTSLSTNQVRAILDALKVDTEQKIKYSATIADPDDDEYIITSTYFTYNGQTALLRNKLSSNVIQVINQNTGQVIVDNIGSWTGDTITLNYFNPSAIAGSVTYIKLAALPANQSAITPTRNDILKFDEAASKVTAVSVSV